MQRFKAYCSLRPRSQGHGGRLPAKALVQQFLVSNDLLASIEFLHTNDQPLPSMTGDGITLVEYAAREGRLCRLVNPPIVTCEVEPTVFFPDGTYVSIEAAFSKIKP